MPWWSFQSNPPESEAPPKRPGTEPEPPPRDEPLAAAATQLAATTDKLQEDRPIAGA